MNKRDLYGSGIYLSTLPDVAISFAPSTYGIGSSSKIGNGGKFSIVGVAEVIDIPGLRGSNEGMNAPSFIFFVFYFSNYFSFLGSFLINIFFLFFGGF